jgi:transmembrane sensor
MGGNPIQEAARWDARLRAGETTPQTYSEFQAWRCADPANAEAFDTLGEAIEILRHNLGGVPAARRSAGMRWRRPATLAASLAALAATGILIFHDPAGPLQVYRAGAAPARVELADGSHVELSPRSQMQVRFRSGRREARLVSGSARFSIANYTERPFVVTADDRQITAEGQVFDVALAPDQVRVATRSGGVRVRCWHGLLPRVTHVFEGQRMIAERGTDNARVEPTA